MSAEAVRIACRKMPPCAAGKMRWGDTGDLKLAIVIGLRYTVESNSGIAITGAHSTHECHGKRLSFYPL